MQWISALGPSYETTFSYSGGGGGGGGGCVCVGAGGSGEMVQKVRKRIRNELWRSSTT